MKKTKLTNNSIKILANLMKAKRPLSVRRISIRTNISWKTADDNIKRLKQRGLVKCKKTKRRNYCELTPQAKRDLGL